MGIAPPAQRRLPVVVFGAGAQWRRDVALGEPFDIAIEGSSEGLALDTSSATEHVRCPPVLAPGLGFVSSDPPHGARDLALGALTFRLRFGAALAPPSADLPRAIHAASNARSAAAFTVRDAALDGDGRTLVIDIDETEPGREHVLAISASLHTAHDLPLPPIEIAFSVRDATGIAAPRIVRTEPAHGATGVPADLARIVVEFSEPMRNGRGFRSDDVRALTASGRVFPILGESTWTDSRTLAIELAAPLTRGARHALPFGPQFASTLGVRLAPFELAFDAAP